MKTYTDIEQSKKLAEMLPIESADMFYTSLNRDYPWIWIDKHLMEVDDIPCWSLAALLGVLSSASLDSSDDHYFRLHCKEKFSEWHDNAVDACVEMILKLKHEKLL